MHYYTYLLFAEAIGNQSQVTNTKLSGKLSADYRCRVQDIEAKLQHP